MILSGIGGSGEASAGVLITGCRDIIEKMIISGWKCDFHLYSVFGLRLVSQLIPDVDAVCIF